VDERGGLEVAWGEVEVKRVETSEAEAERDMTELNYLCMRGGAP
jgi:hypothetical protein